MNNKVLIAVGALALTAALAWQVHQAEQPAGSTPPGEKNTGEKQTGDKTKAEAKAVDEASEFLQLKIPLRVGSRVSEETIGDSKRPVLVNFWATWCAPCIEEMPALSQLAQQYPQIRFVGIGVDSESKVQDFIAKNPISFPVSASGAAALEWTRALGNQANGLPFTVIILPNGQVIDRILGPVDVQKLSEQLAQLTENARK